MSDDEEKSSESEASEEESEKERRDESDAENKVEPQSEGQTSEQEEEEEEEKAEAAAARAREEMKRAETDEEDRSDNDIKEERKKREEEARREEVAQERQRKQEEKQRQEAEASKKQRKPGQKRRGLGGLSKEKKQMLKELIMQKAAEIMKAERKKELEKREEHVKQKIGTLSIDGLSEDQLKSKIAQLHEQLKQLEGEKYDWEEKLRKQDFEIMEMTVKANDNKGKFVKPVLRKVSKTEGHMARFEKKEATAHTLSSFRNQLKSTGHSKYALEEKDESGTKATWMKPKEEGAAEGAAPAEGAPAQ